MIEHPLFGQVMRNSAGALGVVLLVVGTSLLCSPAVFAQGTTLVAAASPAPEFAPENPDDPAYTAYRQGYNLILEEKWEAARKKLLQVIEKYPQSSYVDDAQYWIAYSYRGTSRPKAISLYRLFLEHYAGSSYYDDAVADLNQLQLQEALANLPQPPGAPDTHLEFMVQTRMPEEMRRLEHQVQQLQTVSRRKFERRIVVPSFKGDSLIEINMPALRFSFGMENIPPKLRVRVDALRALSEAREDPKTFHTLRAVAIDQRQPIPLRETAMESLTGFTKFDVGAVYIEIALKDTNEEVQAASVEYLARAGRDKGKSLESLIELFNTMPPVRTRQLGTTLFAIAEIGDERATDFLIRVAHSHQNYELRSDAVYYLGNLGTEKARQALQQILMDR
jgi:hypothetical protein